MSDKDTSSQGAPITPPSTTQQPAAQPVVRFVMPQGQPLNESLDATPTKPKDSAPSRTGVIAKLAYWHGGHNASENSWGRLPMMVDVEDDEAVAEYFFKAIASDARKPLEAEIVRLKALLFDSHKA